MIPARIRAMPRIVGACDLNLSIIDMVNSWSGIRPTGRTSPIPGNSANPHDTSVCWKSLPATPASK